MAEWADVVKRDHMTHVGKNAYLAKLLFLQILRLKKFYGCQFYKVRNTVPQNSAYFTQTTEGNIVIGINTDGIHLLDPFCKRIEKSIPFNEINRWETYKNKYFWMNVRNNGNKSSEDFILTTPQAELIQDTLTDIVYEIKKAKYIIRHIKKQQNQQ